jgi:hypothetical protein
MNLSLPDGMSARLELPASPDSKAVLINGKSVPAKRDGARLHVDQPVSGTLSVVVE